MVYVTREREEMQWCKPPERDAMALTPTDGEMKRDRPAMEDAMVSSP